MLKLNQCYIFGTVFILFSMILTEDYHRAYAFQKFIKENEYLEFLNYLLGDKKGNAISRNKIGIPKIVLNAQADDFDQGSADEHIKNDTPNRVFVIKDLNKRVTEDFLDDLVSTKHLRSDKDDADNTLKRILRTMDGSQSDSDTNNEFKERSKYEEDEDDCDSSELMSSDEDYPSTATKQRQRISRGKSRSCRKPRSKCIKACYSTYRSVCRYYACSRGMKSMFRYKCKRNCRSQMDSWY